MSDEPDTIGPITYPTTSTLNMTNLSPRMSQKSYIKLPNKRDDGRKRDNFFYQTLNNAGMIYSPTSTKVSSSNLFITRPMKSKTK